MALNQEEIGSHPQPAPSWLLSTFVDAVRDCGSTASTHRIEAAAHAILERWTAPHRYFHNQQYLATVLPRIDEVAPASHDPAEVRLALWFYGAAVDHPLNCEDLRDLEAAWKRCCELTSATLRPLDVSAPRIHRICQLTRVLLANYAPPRDVDAAVLHDANLSVFAATPQEYKRARLALRKALGYLSDEAFLVLRRRFLRCLLARDQIFTSPLGIAWEALARQNIEAELSNIDAALTKLGLPLAGEDDAAVVRDYCGWAERTANVEPVVATLDADYPLETTPTADSAPIPSPSDPDRANQPEPDADATVNATPNTASPGARVTPPPNPSAPTAKGSESSSRESSAKRQGETKRSENLSSLEMFPDVLEPPAKHAPKRLSAKEQARASRISNR